MDAKHILLIENDTTLCQMLNNLLSNQGFVVYTVSDGEQGLRQFYRQHFDVVLLDIMLPSMSGWEVLRQLRQSSNTPVIITTALFREEYASYAARHGATYLKKPFSRVALLTSIEAACQTAMPLPDNKKKTPSANKPAPSAPNTTDKESAVAVSRQHDRYCDDHLQIDLATRQVWVEGKRVKLTATEYRLLEYLFRHANQVLTYQQILDTVWGWEYRNSTHYVHVFVSQLRQKLEANLDQPHYLLTERGIGYFFAV